MQYTDEELESMICNYRQIRDGLKRIRESIMTPYIIEDTNIGGGSSGFLSKPTEMTAIKLAENDDLNAIKNIGLAIENTYAALPPDKQKMMLAYYIDRKPNIKNKEVAKQLHMDRTTLWRWNIEIVNLYRKELGRLNNN